MNRRQRFWNIATIYAVGFLQMGGAGLSPVLSELGRAFPQYSTTAIQFVSTIPSVFVILTNLVTGWLCERFPKKYITAVGCGLAAAFALLGFWHNSSLALIYVWAAVLGIATSLSCTVSPAIVNEMFEPEERVGIFGTRACFSSLGTMLMTFAGGYLVAIHWRYGFLVYLIMIPGLVMSLLCHPRNTKLAKAAIRMGDSEPMRPEKLVFPCFISLAVSFLYSTAMVNASMLVAESGFVPAESAAVMGGVLTTVLLAVGGGVGILVDALTRRVGLHCITVGFAGLALGYLGIFLSGSFAMLIVSALLCGGAITLVMPHAQVLGSQAGGSRQELGLSITLIFANLGTVCSPLMTNFASAVFGTQAVCYRFLTAAALAALTTLITAGYVHWGRKKS